MSVRKMLILGALPLPCEGPWVPLGIGVWVCDFRPELAEKVLIVVEDHNGETHTHNLLPGIQLTGKKVKARVLEEVELDRLNIGVTRIK